jgi:hypothetical protein
VLKAAAAVLVRGAGRLHNAVEGQELGHDEFADPSNATQAAFTEYQEEAQETAAMRARIRVPEPRGGKTPPRDAGE